ncbi:sulfotransferase domain-containing protein [Breoghania sp.]|uniref:sulfotransferase domain-containing protein n=1 Tax=Breoghania sp. TaxID=2065378 RepID=UPI0029C9F3B2|nr:sulfotransferase domain-containing protein [Breoghania sp.]
MQASEGEGKIAELEGEVHRLHEEIRRLNFQLNICSAVRAFYETGIPSIEPVVDGFSASENGYLFVSGLPRSGTSALGALLNLSRDIAMYMELKTQWWPYSPQSVSVEHVSQFLNETHQHYKYNKEIWEKSKSARYVGDKRPLFLSNCIDKTLENFQGENLKVVHIFRNIKDIALSYKGRVDKGKGNWPAWRGPFAAVNDFNITNQFLRDAPLHRCENFKFVNYSDLFTSVDRCMELFKWVGVADQEERSLLDAVNSALQSASYFVWREKQYDFDEDYWTDFESRIDVESAREVERLYGAKIL